MPQSPSVPGLLLIYREIVMLFIMMSFGFNFQGYNETFGIYIYLVNIKLKTLQTAQIHPVSYLNMKLYSPLSPKYQIKPAF
ncbi:Ephrin-A2 [Manis pentadactyla]|nr:Ephrin-A2 [Manis pentadactyla]